MARLNHLYTPYLNGYSLLKGDRSRMLTSLVWKLRRSRKDLEYALAAIEFLALKI